MQVFTLVSDPVRLTSVLVVGSQRALLVDTGSGPEQAVRLLAVVRQITDRPLIVANTHDHWDHFFGNATFAEAGAMEFVGSPGFVRDSPGSAWLQHAEASEHAFDLPSPDQLAVPVRALEDGEVLTLGPEPDDVIEALVATGHTDTDLVLRVGPLLLVGDLLEEGAPPQVGLDASPVAWVRTLDRLLEIPGITHFVPGHGRIVDRAFASTQRTDLVVCAASDGDDEDDAEAGETGPPARVSAAAPPAAASGAGSGTGAAGGLGTEPGGTDLLGVRVERIL